MTTDLPTVDRRHGSVPAAEFDGGDMDCGGGLLLAITSAMRGVADGEVLLLRTSEPSVLADLPAWARLAGHDLLNATEQQAGRGPWSLMIRRGQSGRPSQQPDYSQGEAVPLGSRLWLYSNFHCNLACSYCCAESSPHAQARLMPVALAAAAAAEFVGQGGRELLVTGGEPFLHPELDALVAGTSAFVPVTVLTNAMVFTRGRRREMLESFDRDTVTLQISLDSAAPGLHDRQRGIGSHRKAIAGIRLASDLGFRVRVTATYLPEDAADAGDLDRVLDEMNIAEDDRVIRPVALEGSAAAGMAISLDTVYPEPTLTVDGAWWHPVAVTNSRLKVAEAPLPLSHVLDVMRDVVAVQEAAGEQDRSVFRCT